RKYPGIGLKMSFCNRRTLSYMRLKFDRAFVVLSLLLLAAAPGPASTAPHPAVAAAPASTMRIISLWGGARESIALRSDGTVWDWGLSLCALGNGSCGKLGDGTEISRTVPVQVHGPGNVGFLNSVTAIMGGEHHNYALRADGTVWAWGGNFVGQLGIGSFTNSNLPVQ